MNVQVRGLFVCCERWTSWRSVGTFEGLSGVAGFAFSLVGGVTGAAGAMSDRSVTVTVLGFGWRR
jgi:hypothetical protein